MGLLAVPFAAMLAGCAGPQAAAPTDARFDEAKFCSRWLADNDGKPQAPEDHRRCVIAVASTYINAEENSIPPEDQLYTEDTAHHHLGEPAVYAPGNRAKEIAKTSHQVIAAIRNRHWAVDGNEAWITYDGYLKARPDKPGFHVAERITLEKGLIKEVFIAGVAMEK
jgi:hypothetical protein